MREITVSKTDLLAVLQENRATHRTVFDAALEAYGRAARETLQGELDRLADGKVREVYVHLPRPQDHTTDYDRVIRMVTMHTGDTIQLGETDAAQYVMDDWHWKREFVKMSGTYAPASTAAAYGDLDDS
jgi:hypothetical protein